MEVKRKLTSPCPTLHGNPQIENRFLAYSELRYSLEKANRIPIVNMDSRKVHHYLSEFTSNPGSGLGPPRARNMACQYRQNRLTV